MSNCLHIAIDPGFDSMKVVANGKVFKFPFNAVETDERKISDYGLRDDFILYKDETGTTYRVGAYARELIFEGSEQGIESFYTEQRFISREFVVGVRTAIAMAIDKLGLSMDGLEVKIIVALPHACRVAYASTIVGSLVGEHRFEAQFGKNTRKEFCFTVGDENVHTVSQTIAAILGESSDSKGRIDEDKFKYLSDGPTLVLDGGYYTFGFVSVNRGGSVDDDKAESDTRHAMKNVYMAVAEAIADKRPDIKHYMMEHLIGQGGIVKYIDNGKAATIDLKAIKAEKVKEICQSMIEYLNGKYNHLLDYNYVVVTGGTGAQFFKQMLAYYEKAGIMDKDHMILTSAELDGKRHPIEYSIAIGAYKGLLGQE